MKYKFLSVILLIMIFSVGAVCAQDNSTDDVDIISAGSDDVISLEDNPIILQDNGTSDVDEIHINDTNYYQYFDENGTMNDNISADSTIYIDGDIINKTFIIDRPLTILGFERAWIFETSFSFIEGSDGSILSGIFFENYGVSPVTIVNASDITIFENWLSLVSENATSPSVIFANAANGLNVTDNSILYWGKTDGYTPLNAVTIAESDDVVFEDNEFGIQIPSCDVGWKEDPAGSGNWVANPVSEGVLIRDSNGVSFKRNNIRLNSTEILSVADYDTVYVFDIKNCEDVDFSDNTINAEGFSYIYGMVISGENFNIENNTLNIDSVSYYANGIDIEGNASGTVKNNNIAVTSPSVAYPVYSAMSNGDVDVVYVGNNIAASSDIVYGMELSGNNESVFSNYIDLSGNKTTGIAASSKVINISNNTIIASGENLGNSSTGDKFESYTVAINIYGSQAEVFDNNIMSTAAGIVTQGGNITIGNNTIFVLDNGLCDSAAIAVFIADSLNICDNNITYSGKSDGTFNNYAMFILNSTNVNITNNDITAKIPSAPVDWQEIPAGSGNWVGVPVSLGIRMSAVNGLEFAKNSIDVSYDNVTGDFDTIYGVYMDACDDAKIYDNSISADGHSYVYGLLISGQNFDVFNNGIHSYSDEYYACGVDIEGNASGIVRNNIITAQAPVVSYPVYSSMSGNEVYAVYFNNTIFGKADIVYGMELAGNDESVIQNIILIGGNKTTGIAAKSDVLNIENNTITANGLDLGNTTTGDSFEPETVGIKIIAGNATVFANNIKTANEGYTVNVTDTDAVVTFNTLVSKLLYGDYSVYYTGNATVHDNYPDYDAFIDTEDVVLFYKNGTRFVAKLHTIDGIPLINGTIKFNINGVEYARKTDENGTASIAINLDPGKYDIVTRFDPENATSAVNENTIEVLPTVYGDDLVKTFKNETQYYATFLDGQGNPLAEGTNVTFNINGVFYTRQINGSEGKAKLNINLNQGEYIITAYHPINGEMHSNNITVLPLIQSNDLVKYFRNESQFVVTILGADGNPVGAGENVTFNINGVFYTRQTNESGQAKLNINLAQGNYTITTMYNGCSVANNIEVLPILYAKDLVMKQGTSDQFRAQLYDGQGNPYSGQNITFNIHGIFYQRTTDDDGWAALNIKLSAAANTYIITSMYNDCVISNKIVIEPA
ncbi:hypothetical protein [Methanobrevibacter sp.]|uniref:hypothetical protein n=1 Tax=Methanobrevibacter sp. TaxID=66852 RepID=UPI00388E095A